MDRGDDTSSLASGGVAPVMPGRKAMGVPQLGRWYEAKAQVRAAYGEYWKGILVGKRDTAIIFNYVGARRSHYGDHLDYASGKLTYIGEGKTGDQMPNARNRALLLAYQTGKPVHVYLDCGDLFMPKRLLYAGLWNVFDYHYEKSKTEKRKVYRFKLKPSAPEILKFLHFTFSAIGDNPAFERDLKVFAKARAELYESHGDVIRAQDNIAGEIGEYFAIKAFNSTAGENHLVRLTGSHRDIDAIRIGTGQRFAIKTISKFPSTTSNIWSKDIASAVDYFLICLIDRKTLLPRAVFSIPTSKAQAYLRRDGHQGSLKLSVSPELVRRCRVHLDLR